MKKLIFLVLLVFSLSVSAQVYVEDRSVVPVGPTFTCAACDPFNKHDPEIDNALNEAVAILWKLCWESGFNQWDHESSIETCGRGMFHVENDWGDWGTYGFTDVDLENHTVRYGLFYYGFLNPFGLDLKHYSVVP